jgi:DNA-binding LacI/PurR family transcriptional regulator
LGLTTVRQSAEDKGRIAGALLLHPPRNGMPVIETLETQLLIGRTTGPAPTR